jgi:transcriptional regulator with XRE-family HTH domain
MNKDKTVVIERIRSKIKPENRIFVQNNLEISDQISELLKTKGWTQKDLALSLGKSESEVSKLLSGLHNLTLKTLVKLEVQLGSDIITTPKKCKMESNKLHEAIADISYIAGYRRYYSGDSRIDITDFINWANEFEDINKFEDWSNRDYMLEIELFADQKINEARLINKRS